MSTLLDTIKELAGPQREETFVFAADYLLSIRLQSLVETGCYRGIPADGNSTIILAMIAKRNGGMLDSYELNPEHIKMAKEKLAEKFLLDWVRFHQGDSVASLKARTEEISFAYLDSYDHEENNPLPCQQHQLAEVEAILPLMMGYGLFGAGAFLLDDNIGTTGGKVALSSKKIEQTGFKLRAAGYQLFYTM